jgi:hypothetical protein
MGGLFKILPIFNLQFNTKNKTMHTTPFQRMRNRTKSISGLRFSSFLVLLAVGTLFMPSCSKDRAQTATTTVALGYTAPTAFYNKYKQPVQVLQVDSPGTGPIIDSMGTKLYPNANIFMFPNGNSVIYPFTLQMIDIYTVKQMILSTLPTVAGGKILEAKPEISARAFKGAQELVLRPGKKFHMETATMTSLLTGMSVYYGFSGSGFTDWTKTVGVLNPAISPDTLSSITNLASTYSMNIALMGWVNCGRLFSYTAATTPITFNCTGNTPQNINVFLVFNNSNSVMQAYSLVSGPVPVGTQLTMIAIAYDANNNLVYDKQSLTVTAGMSVTLNPIVTTEANLLSVLGTL